MSYITLLSFKRTSSMTSIFIWPYQSNFCRHFCRKLKCYCFKKGSTVREDKYRPKYSSLNGKFQFTGSCKTGFLKIRKIWSFSTQKNAQLKNNGALLMFFLNLRHNDATKRPKLLGTSPWLAKNIWCCWSKNIRVGWRQREASLRNQTKGNFSPNFKDYLPKVPEHLELFLFSDKKSVVALKGIAENIENQSMETQNWLTARKLVVKLSKTAGYHGKLFEPSIYADDDF